MGHSGRAREVIDIEIDGLRKVRDGLGQAFDLPLKHGAWSFLYRLVARFCFQVTHHQGRLIEPGDHS